MAVHETAQALTGVEELELDQTEAEKLAEKIAKVRQFYRTGIVPPKVLAWIELSCCCTMLYGPRIKAYRMRTKRERERRKLSIVPAPGAAQAHAAAQAAPQAANGAPVPTAYTSPGGAFGFQGDMTGPDSDGSN